MQDGILELWLRLTALHLEEPTSPTSPVRAIRDQWLLASRGYFGGCIPDGVEDAVSTDEGKRLVLKAISSLAWRLNTCPEILDQNVLNLLGVEGVTFVNGCQTWRLQEVCSAVVGLIEGRIGGDTSQTELMPGSKDAPNQALQTTPVTPSETCED
jgi:hypothetical protein